MKIKISINYQNVECNQFNRSTNMMFQLNLKNLKTVQNNLNSPVYRCR